jgi:CheY-like chemotaxis protein
MSFALVIDDNMQMADSLVKLLGELGIEAKPCYGSGQGMTALRAITPSAVFLDINMPGVTGHEVLKFLRREPRLFTIPVFVITSDDQLQTKQLVMREGAHKLIVKPVELDILERALKDVGLL